MAKKRTKLEVIRDILEILKRNREVKITHLIYKSNLSNNSIKPYLEELVRGEFIQKNDDGVKKSFVILKKGEEFLKEFGKMKILSEAYGL